MPLDPMTIMAIGSAIAGGVSTIAGGRSQAAAARTQNQQATRNWIASNTQKTVNNSRQQFQSAYNYLQQLKRNAAIQEAAYEFQRSSQQNLREQTNQANSELSDQIQSQQAKLIASTLNKGIGLNSSLQQNLLLAQALDGLEKVSIINRNSKIEKENIDKQFKGMLSQQTENIFAPNIELYDEAPIYGSTSSSGTDIAGLLQIGAGVAGAAYGLKKP